MRPVRFQLRLTHKIAAIGCVGVIGLAAVGVIYQQGTWSQDNARKVAEDARAISALNIPEISSIEAADLFRGKNVPEGKYSLLIKVALQSREATLTDAQISDISARIVAALEKDLGAQLRTA